MSGTVTAYAAVYWHGDALLILLLLTLILSALLALVVVVFRTAIVIGGSRLCFPLKFAIVFALFCLLALIPWGLTKLFG
jgi:hypothetical protein